MEPEKNFVTISKLFDWSKQYSVKTVKGKNMKVYVRLVGDADLNKARVFALRKSAELREKLRTKGSDERLAFISESDSINHEKMVEITTMLGMRNFTQEAIKDVKLPFPKEPNSDAETEEREKYQKEVDDYPKKREILVREYINKLTDKQRTILSKLDESKLSIEYETAMISELCEEEVLKRFREYCVYCGAFKDSNFTQKFFETFDEFDNLPRDKKDEFITFYTLLEMDTSELKK